MADDLSSFGEDLSSFGAPIGQREDLSSFGEDLSSFGAPIEARAPQTTAPGRMPSGAPGLLADEPAKSYDELGMLGRRGADLERGLTGMEAGGAATRVMYGMEEADVDSAFDLIDQGKVDEAFELAGPTRVNAVLAYRDATPEQRAELRAQRAENTDLPGQIAELMEVNKRYNALPNNPRMAQLAEAGNAKEYGKAFDIFLSDPFGIIASVGTESAPAMLPGMAASIATANPVVGMGMGSAWVEQAASLQQGIDEAVRAAGGDPANPEDVQRILSDPTVRAALGKRADIRAGIIGLVDAASGGLASKTMGVGQGVTKELTNVAVQTPIQGAMGAGGEGAAEYVTTGEIKPGDMALEFLGEAVTAPADIAVAALSGAKKSPATSLTPDPKPVGPLQGSQQPAPITPADDRSAIPTPIIQAGKTIVAQALAQSDADKILSAAGFPTIGARVNLSYPDGRKISGNVVDAFSATSNETGATDNGIKIKLDDGTVFEEFEDTIRQAGLRIENAGEPTVTGAPGVAPGMVNEIAGAQGLDTTGQTELNVSRDTPSVTPLEGQDVGGETVQQMPGAPGQGQAADVPGVRDAGDAGAPSAPQGGVAGTGAAPAQPPAQVRQEGGAWAVDFGGATYRGDAGKPFKNKAQADAFLARKLGDGSKAAPLKPQDATHAEAAAGQANTEPTAAQIEADNYKKVHYKLHGLDISIENPKGSTRRSKPDSPVKWEVVMPADYGDIKGTKGADGDNIDVTVGPNPQSVRTWIIDQIDPATGRFDEHKTFLGFDTQEQVLAAYDASFSDGSGPSRRGAVVAGTTVNFKRWLNTADTTKPLAYRGKTAAGLQGSPTAAEQGGIPLPTEETNEEGSLQPAGKAQAGQGSQEGGAIQKGGEEQSTGAVVLAWVDKAQIGDAIEFDGLRYVVSRANQEGTVRRLRVETPDGEIAGFISTTDAGKLGMLGNALKSGEAKHAQPKPMDTLKAKVEEKRKVDALPGMTPMGAKPTVAKTETEPKPEPVKTPPKAAPTPAAPQAEKPATPAYGATNKLVSQDRAAELRERLKAKFKDLKNLPKDEQGGLDPEMLALGTELAVFHIEAGTRKFAAFAKAMAEDLGQSLADLRPYLRGWYNSARDMLEDRGGDVNDMDTPDQVKAALVSVMENETASANIKSDEQDRDTPSQDVGSPGVGEAGAGLAEGQPGGEAPARPLDGRPAKDDAGPRPGGREGPGARPDRPQAEGATPIREGGNAADGRGGASGAGVESAGAGGRVPAGGRPNYFVGDPEQLIGGTPKVRFARNRKAIEAFRSITEENRDPTKEELDAMAGYIGWGSFGQELFQGTWARPYPKDGWAEESKWMREHLGQQEWESAQSSIINAHYTDPPTVLTMWDMVRKMGFTGGRVLEPSMGIGNFFGLMPRDLEGASELTGIEMDSLTGGMATLLYPQANVSIKPYQDSKTADGFYDLVIGNWPFAKDGPSDRRYDKLGASLHDFFFVKALDQVRPGGLVVGITSAGTMDKMGRPVRLHLAKNAELVAAFRLPSGAFEKYAGTSVVTDIIILKKREKPDTKPQDWTETVKQSLRGNEINLNKYWLKNRDNILGQLDFGSGSTYGRPSMIVNRPADFMQRLKSLPGRVPEGIYSPAKRGNEPRFVSNNTKDRQGAITIQDDKLYVVQGDRLAPLNDVIVPPKDRAAAKKRDLQVRGMVVMRMAYGGLIDAERDGKPETEEFRKLLKTLYDAFVKSYGSIGDSDGLSVLRRLEDPFHAVVAALENPDGSPAAILSKPTTRSKKKLDKPTVRDAFVLARNEGIVVDMAAIAERAATTEEAASKELLGSKAIYRTPGGGFEVADVYLSGNIRRKMREALDAKERGEDMDGSIEALKGVMPKDVPYFQIEAKLGATWAGNDAYRQFLADILGVKVSDEISVEFKVGSWKVRLHGGLNDRPEARTTWGSEHITFHKLVSAAMNSQSLTIRYKDSDGNMVTDDAATKEVNEKATRIREEFSAWAWRDVERRVEFEKNYNEIMNAIAVPKYDGSFLELSGMALSKGDKPFNLREHQTNAIWRGIVSGAGIYAHEVGTGKTFTMGGIAVESRRYGVARKPLIFAHNANSATVAREIQEMYPGAKVLYIDNLTPETIDVTMRRIANDEWDAVVVPHSLIDRFALSEKTLNEIAAEEIAALEQEALDAAAEDGAKLDIKDMDDEKEMKKVRSPTAKQLVHQRNKIKESIKKMAARASAEGAIAFEDLGVDMIQVDEAHVFKKPPIATKMRLKGLNTQTSNRSIALRFLTDYVKRINNGKGVHVFTGTPITNTLTEIYNMMRFAMDHAMSKDGIKEWDAWFNTFADSSTDVELTPTGEYDAVTRLAAFVNVAELRRMAGEFMDIVFADDMPEFKPRSINGKTLADELTTKEREELESGRSEDPEGRPYKKIVTDVGPLSPVQREALDELVELARKFKNASKKERRELMLSGDPSSPIIVEGNAAKAGLDVRLYKKGAEDHPQSKANRAVKNILKVYNDHAETTQVLFMENGFSDFTVKSGGKNADGEKNPGIKVPRLNLAKDIVDKLVAGGIPREQIAIVDGSVGKQKRKQIADAMNENKIRVVIGNSATLGVGVNMQTNLRAMHHLDAPWMPGDLEQRNGRGWRQGNKWNTVLEFRYITEKLDGRRWQVLTIKDRFIKAFMKADESVRIIDGDAVSLEEGESANDLADTLAQAAGDPRLLIKNKLANDIKKLEGRERLHTFGIKDAKDQVVSLNRSIDFRTERAGKLEQDAATYEKAKEAGFTATVAGNKFDKREDAGKALNETVTKMARGDKIKLAEVQGFTLRARWPVGQTNPDYWLTSPDTGLEYTVSPSIASIEGKLRNIAGAAKDMRQEIEDARGSIGRMEEAQKQPFAQAAMLESKREKYKALLNDLNASPIPPPDWLRHGAPVGAEVEVRFDGRRFSETVTVEGHRWGGDNYYVIVDHESKSVEVPYLDVLRDFNPAYEPHPFEAPPKPKDATPPVQPPAAPVSKAQRGKEHRGVDAGSPELGNLIRLLNERMRQVGIADAVRLRIMSSLEDNVFGWFHSQTSWGRLIEVSLESGDTYGTLNHEVIHALRDLNLFTSAEWNTLEAAARSSPLLKVIQKRYADLNEGEQLEEVIAEMFRKYANRAGYGPMTIRGLLERISHLIQAVREAFRETGYKRAQDVFARVEAGEVGTRDRLMEETWLDPDLIGPDPNETSVGFASKAQRSAKPERPKGAKDKLSIENAETNRRVQDAFKGIDNGEGKAAKMKEWLADKWHGFSRHYRNLPDTAEYADVGQQLRKLEASPGAAKERIVRILREITEGMNEDDLKLFSWKVALDDLAWEVQQEHDLPFGLTPENFTSEKAKIDAAIAGRPDLTWAVRQRKLLIRDVANSMVKAGVLHRDQVKNPNYYRHQVLHYARAVAKPSGGTGKKLRTPYWAKRMGSTLDINLNLLEAEFDWLHKAMVAVDTVKTIDWIKKSEHNIRGQVVAAAKAHNDAQIKALIDAEGDGGPLHDQWTKFRQRIAMGLAKVKKAIEDGDLYVPEEWEDAAGNLTGDRANDANIFPFLAWIMDNDDAGASGAAQTLKAISERREWVKSMLGPKYADPLNVGELVSQFAPEGYVAWQPDSPDANGKALRLYVAKSVPEQALQRMLEKALDGVTLPAEFSERIKRDMKEELRSAMTVGASKYEMVITQELADTLNNLRNEFEENVIAALIEKPTRLWKLWTLFNPRRVLKYNLNNLSGDLDAVIAGNPHIMKRVPKAARELFNVMAKKGKPTERYMEAIERGVFDSGFTLQEIPDINYLSDFEHLTKPMNWKNPLAVTKEAARRGWAFTRGATTWRENVFRYAAYLDYVERLESGMTPEQIGYGATRPEIVDAVGSKKDQAALMARDLIGDYGAISAFGQQLRRYVIPFWSFQEINLRRYWRLNANAWKQGVVKGAKTSAITGAALGLRTTLWLYIRMFALYGAINIWNYLMFDDEEDDLDPEERARLHLTLGKWNGELVTMRLNGSLSDIMSWFGFSDALAVMYEVERGRADLWDILGTIAKAPVNKIVNSITPVIKTPLESATGTTLYPDVFDARPIRDNWRNLAKSFSLENEYDLLTDSPSRGYLKSWVEGVVSARDPGESAYNRMRFMVVDWEQRVKGQEPYGGSGTPRSNAYYKLRTALKYGDKVAEADARKELDKLGVKASDLKGMFKNAHPLGGLAKKDRPAFMQSLSSEERRVLGIAERWYQDVFR